MEILLVSQLEQVKSLSRLQELLEEQGFKVKFSHTFEESMALIAPASYPVIFLDFRDAHTSLSLQLNDWLNSQSFRAKISIVFIVNDEAVETINAVIQRKADNYFVTRWPTQTQEAQIRILFNSTHLNQEKNLYNDQLIHLATHDLVTGLQNKYSLNQSIQKASQEALGGMTCFLIYVDLDNFKLVNDLLGHSVGDQFLHRWAELLRKFFKNNAEIFRLGGDEFVIITHDSSLKEVETICKLLALASDEISFTDAGQTFFLNASFGISEFYKGLSGKDVLSNADAACYQAKILGKNRTHIYQPHDDTITRLRMDQNWVSVIRSGISDKRFVMYTQPIVDIDTGTPIFHEALIRYQLPDGQIYMPKEFLPIAERFQLSSEIDAHIASLSVLAIRTHPELTLSINISGQTLNNSDSLIEIADYLEAYNIPPTQIIFEITEQQLIANFEQTSRVIDLLKERGYRFSLDDFGVGYCNLVYLQSFNVDFIKIDGHLIESIVGNPINQHIVKAITEIATELGIKTIAEFVENQETVDCIKQLGISLAQGFFFSRPSPFLLSENDSL